MATQERMKLTDVVSCLVYLPFGILYGLFARLKYRRFPLKDYFDRRLSELEAKPYAHWVAQDFPITWGDVFEGEEVEGEIDLLESEPEYVHLLLDVAVGGWNGRHVSTSTIIERTE